MWKKNIKRNTKAKATDTKKERTAKGDKERGREKHRKSERKRERNSDRQLATKQMSLHLSPFCINQTPSSCINSS